MDVGNLISDFSAFSKSNLNIWKFMVHILLKPGLENFEHYFTSMWDEYNYVVVGAFFVIALLWDWNENWLVAVLWPLLCFPNLLAYWVQHIHSIIFWIWNSSTEIPPPPLALFIVMLPKAHLTSHFRMSGSRYVIRPSWLYAVPRNHQRTKRWGWPNSWNSPLFPKIVRIILPLISLWNYQPIKTNHTTFQGGCTYPLRWPTFCLWSVLLSK